MSTLHKEVSRRVNKGSDRRNEPSIKRSTQGLANEGKLTMSQHEPNSGPLWRICASSILTGFVLALVLTLGVFGGGAEHVITGSALLAFAFGWAMLEVLSTRFTSQPQKWALVPAGFMAIAGLVLLISSPDDQALNAAGWVWPLIMLAVTGWMVVQLRRSLNGSVRWLLYPVVAVLVVGSVGGMYETVARARDQRAYPAPGTMYDVGGKLLHLNCSGSGGPTVVLQSGLGETSANWARITAEVSRTTRVCSYDRAGQGWSDNTNGPQDGFAIAADLHTLLERSGEAGPYLLVGHSAGGTYAVTYAAQYPDEVAGMVLLDSMSPDQFTVLPDFANEYSMMRRGLGVLPSLARLGVAQILPSSVFSNLPEPAASQVRAFSTSARQMRNMRDEQSVYRVVFEQARALTTLDGKPLVVVTSTEQLEKSDGWSEAQDQLAMLSTNSQRRVADATHGGLVDHEVEFEPSVSAIADVVQSIRTSEPVVTR